MDAERRALTGMGFSERLIRTGPATEVTNCHGWVFTAGEYWLAPDDVELILTDNNYESVSEPGPGDLVIYREGSKLLHSGVVRTLMNDGSILVESKWGWMGTFIHPVGGTCYGRGVTYYHSLRGGHTLTGLDAKSKSQQVAGTSHA